MTSNADNTNAVNMNRNNLWMANTRKPLPQKPLPQKPLPQTPQRTLSRARDHHFEDFVAPQRMRTMREVENTEQQRKDNGKREKLKAKTKTLVLKTKQKFVEKVETPGVKRMENSMPK